MDLRELLKKGVDDIIITQDAIYLIAQNTPPPIYSDKHVEHITPGELPAHPELPLILNGHSLKHGDLAQKHRLQRKLLYTYDLSELETTQKQKLSHLLYGTGGRKSLLEELGGERVGRGAFLLPAQHQQEMNDFLKEHGAHYDAREALIGGAP